jgi:hypothetical protein
MDLDALTPFPSRRILYPVTFAVLRAVREAADDMAGGGGGGGGGTLRAGGILVVVSSVRVRRLRGKFPLFLFLGLFMTTVYMAVARPVTICIARVILMVVAQAGLFSE